MAETHGAQPENGVEWIDISEFSEPARSPLSVLFRRLGFDFLFVGIALAVLIVFAGFLAVEVGFSDQVSMTVLIGGLAVLVGGFFYARRSIDEWVSGSTVLGSELPFSKRELDRSVPGLDRSLREILAGVAAFAASRGEVQVSDKQRRDRKLVVFYRFMIGFIFVVAFFAHQELTSFLVNPWLDFVIGAAAIAVSLAVVSAMYRKSVSIGRPSVETVRDYDHRSPVLLLRSFKDDQLRVTRRFRTVPWSVDYSIRFEQAIASRLGHVGPVIAVSAPGEAIPQLGAARARLEDGEWQEKVVEWMGDSVIVAMIAGSTEWIRWELDQIIERGGIERLFILIPPPGPSHIVGPLKERWLNVLQPFAGTPWEEALDSIDPESTLLVQVEPLGHVTAFRSAGHMVRDYQLAITLGIFLRHCAAAE